MGTLLVWDGIFIPSAIIRGRLAGLEVSLTRFDHNKGLSKSSELLLPSFRHAEFHMHVNLMFWNGLILGVIKMLCLSDGGCQL